MSIETILKNLNDALNANTEAIKSLAAVAEDPKAPKKPAAPAPKKPAAPAPKKPAAPAPKKPVAPAKLTMTAAANGVTYEDYMATEGWTDQMLIDQGLATAAAPAVTPEALNTIIVAEFNRIGDRAPIDAEFKKLGATGAADLPADKYQELIDNVKALVKVA